MPAATEERKEAERPVKQVSASVARDTFSDVLDRALYYRSPTEITRHGHVVAIVVPAPLIGAA